MVAGSRRRDGRIFMLTLRITVWNHQPAVSAGEVRDTSLLFDVTLDDQDQVESLQRQFNGLERVSRPRRAGSAMFTCYRYQIAFFLDGKPVQVYAGSDNHGMWGVMENGERHPILRPRALLEDLHWSIGMPVWVGPQGRLMTPEERRRASAHAPDSN
jgi:hypothetical protein